MMLWDLAALQGVPTDQSIPTHRGLHSWQCDDPVFGGLADDPSTIPPAPLHSNGNRSSPAGKV